MRPIAGLPDTNASLPPSTTYSPPSGSRTMSVASLPPRRSSFSSSTQSTSCPASAARRTLYAAPRPATPPPMMMTFFTRAPFRQAAASGRFSVTSRPASPPPRLRRARCRTSPSTLLTARSPLSSAFGTPTPRYALPASASPRTAASSALDLVDAVEVTERVLRHPLLPAEELRVARASRPHRMPMSSDELRARELEELLVRRVQHPGIARSAEEAPDEDPALGRAVRPLRAHRARRP